MILRPGPSTRGKSNQRRLFLRIPSYKRVPLRRLSGPSILVHTSELPERGGGQDSNLDAVEKVKKIDTWFMYLRITPFGVANSTSDDNSHSYQVLLHPARIFVHESIESIYSIFTTNQGIAICTAFYRRLYNKMVVVRRNRVQPFLFKHKAQSVKHKDSEETQNVLCPALMLSYRRTPAHCGPAADSPSGARSCCNDHKYSRRNGLVKTKRATMEPRDRS